MNKAVIMCEITSLKLTTSEKEKLDNNIKVLKGVKHNLYK